MDIVKHQLAELMKRPFRYGESIPNVGSDRASGYEIIGDNPLDLQLKVYTDEGTRYFSVKLAEHAT